MSCITASLLSIHTHLTNAPLLSSLRPLTVIMAARFLTSCWFGNGESKSGSAVGCLGRCCSIIQGAITQIASFLHEWTPFLLVASYFVFSTCMYMFCTDGIFAMFWFIYLIANFYIAATTVLEALMSLTPCRDARKAVQNVQNNRWQFPTPEEDLLVLDLLIVSDPCILTPYVPSTHEKSGRVSSKRKGYYHG